jgi:transcriptional regulator GlxA family with amidase domain
MPSGGPLRVGIVVFDDVEELDFVGPWEVFGVAGRVFPGSVQTQLVSSRSRRVRGVYGLTVDCPMSIGTIGRLDIVIVPGGKGARAAKEDRELRLYLRRVHKEGTVVASVCTGALVLAAAELLDGKRATTHASALEELRAFPRVHVDPQRIIDLGSIVTSAGISSGIDMALHLVQRFLGAKEAQQVAERMEYRWVVEGDRSLDPR